YATPFAMPGGGREAHLYEMRRRLAFSVFNQRVAKELGGNAEYQHLINFEIMNVNAPLDEDEWAQGLSVMDDLIRYTVQKGFTPAEIESVKRRRLARIDFQLGSFEHMDPEPLAEDLTDSILHHKVYTSYETRLR